VSAMRGELFACRKASGRFLRNLDSEMLNGVFRNTVFFRVIRFFAKRVRHLRLDCARSLK